MRQTVVGVFDGYASAQNAAALLQDRGIDPECIHVTSGEDDATLADSARERRADEDKSILDRIRDFFDGVSDDDDVNTYSEAVLRGGAVVTVDVEEEPQAEVACDTLEQAGALDIDERAAAWRGSGMSPTTTDTSTHGFAEDPTTRRAGSDEVIPVVREDLVVGKRAVQQGHVRIYAHVVEEPVSESVELREERARVERRTVDRPASEADLRAAKERVIEVSETVERPVVEKKARVVEEVSLRKDVSKRQETIKDTVRRTKVDVQDQQTKSRGFRAYEDYAEDFQSDFRSRYEAQGSRYEDYEPAYRFGHALRSEQRYAGRPWEEVELEAERDWAIRYPDSPWQRVKDAVRHAWERVTS